MTAQTPMMNFFTQFFIFIFSFSEFQLTSNSENQCSGNPGLFHLFHALMPPLIKHKKSAFILEDGLINPWYHSYYPVFKTGSLCGHRRHGENVFFCNGNSRRPLLGLTFQLAANRAVVPGVRTALHPPAALLNPTFQFLIS